MHLWVWAGASGQGRKGESPGRSRPREDTGWRQQAPGSSRLPCQPCSIYWQEQGGASIPPAAHPARLARASFCLPARAAGREWPLAPPSGQGTGFPAASLCFGVQQAIASADWEAALGAHLRSGRPWWKCPPQRSSLKRERAEETQVFAKYGNHTAGLCHVCSWVVLQAWLAHLCARRQAGAPQLVCTGFRKAPLYKTGIFSSGTAGTKFIFPLVLPSAIGKWLHLDFASLFHRGKALCSPSYSPSYSPHRWHLLQLCGRDGWARSAAVPLAWRRRASLQCESDVCRKLSLQWVSLCQWNNMKIWCYVIHASSLFRFYLWILANNRWLRRSLCWEIRRWKH